MPRFVVGAAGASRELRRLLAGPLAHPTRTAAAGVLPHHRRGAASCPGRGPAWAVRV